MDDTGGKALKIYRTKQGDMWDYIAWKIYGDESYVSILYQANPKYIDTYIFEDGCEIVCPDITIDDIEEELPDWRDNEDLEGDGMDMITDEDDENVE